MHTYLIRDRSSLYVGWMVRSSCTHTSLSEGNRKTWSWVKIRIYKRRSQNSNNCPLSHCLPPKVTGRWWSLTHRGPRFKVLHSIILLLVPIQCDTEGLLLQKLWLCTGLSSLCFVSSDGPLTAEFCIILYTFKAFHSGHFLKAAQFKIHCRELWSEEVLEREGAARLNCWIKSCRLHTSTFSAR